MNTSKNISIRPGQVWQDYFEPARILAVAEGYAMMRRQESNPFILPLGALKAGAHGWSQLPDAEAKAYLSELENKK